MTADHLKKWHKEAHPEQCESPNEPNPAEPNYNNWTPLCNLIQHMWTTGDIPTELTWSIVVLIPKSDGGHRGIGLLETLWKLS